MTAPGDHQPLVQELTIRVDISELAERLASAVSLRLATVPTSPWLDVKGAAGYLGCSPERIRKLIARKQIPFHQERAGGRLFLHRNELDEWLLRQ